MVRSFAPLGTLLLMTLAAPAARSAGPPAAPWPLSPVARARLDQNARAQPLEGVAEEKYNLAGKIPAWILDRLKLPAEEEARRAGAVHDEFLRGHRVVVPPAGLRKAFDALVQAVPPYLRPASFHWTLTVYASDRPAVSTPGAGHVHVSTALVRDLMADPVRGQAALAWLVAREIGHVALGHSRAGWQSQVLQEHAASGSARGGTRASRVGRMVYLLYSREQEYAADLFALHLCRNANLDLDAALDGMRYLVVRRYPGAVRGDFRPPSQGPFAGVGYYLSVAADPLLRLRRLLMERDGEVEPADDFGLFLFDRRAEVVRRPRPGELRAANRPIVFLHGMHGSPDVWDDFLRAAAERRGLLARPLLVFRYPGNGSLARAGKFLDNEVRRCLPAGARPDFVCHSAGGLVFRYYAERLGGPFGRAAFLGTPHRGSNVTGLKFVVDLCEFAGLLRGSSLREAIALAAASGRGEVGLDLHPDSLFLRYLGSKPEFASRYAVVYGEYMTSAGAAAARLAFASAVRLAKRRCLSDVPEGSAREQAERLFDHLRLPAEILRGDGAVRSRSAVLPGAAEVIRSSRTHLGLPHDAEVIRRVLAWLEK